MNGDLYQRHTGFNSFSACAGAIIRTEMSLAGVRLSCLPVERYLGSSDEDDLAPARSVESR